MKITYKILAALLIPCTSVLLVTCKKTDDDKIFGGDARLRGVVYFNNIGTNTIDTAKTATITMTQAGNASAGYTQQLTDGNFDINYLNAATYNFNIQFIYKAPGSSKSDRYTISKAITFTKEEFADNYQFILSIDSVSTPTLQLTVIDGAGNVVQNARVCLYGDTLTLAANRETCNGSLISGTTNSQGIALFPGLQVKDYYASAYAAIGSDTLNNRSTDVTKLPSLKLTKLTTDTIQVVSSGYTIQITVRDVLGANISGTNVCLYSDSGLMSKFQFTCMGSLAGGITGGKGTITFTGLQHIPYYVSSYKLFTGDTLSNRSTDKMDTITPMKLKIVNKVITIK